MSSFNDNIIVKLHNYTYSYRYIGSMRIIKQNPSCSNFRMVNVIDFLFNYDISFVRIRMRYAICV